MTYRSAVQLRGAGQGAIARAIRQANLGSGGSGSASAGSVFMRYSARAAVPAGGTRYLSGMRGIPTSVLGDSFTSLVTLKGISMNVNVNEDIVTGKDFVLEVFRNPSAPIVIATLTFDKGFQRRVARTYNVAIGQADQIGVRLRRTSGAGASVFNRINCTVEYVLP